MPVQTTFSTTRTASREGTLDGTGSYSVEPLRNDEASAEIAFGVAVKQGSATDERSAKLLTAITGEKVAGIVLYRDEYDTTQLGTTGILPTYEVNVVRQGRMKVICEDGCSIGDPLHVRAVAAGAELAGACLAASDGTDTIDCSANGQWRTSAAAGEIAVLEFDFTNSPT